MHCEEPEALVVDNFGRKALADMEVLLNLVDILVQKVADRQGKKVDGKQKKLLPGKLARQQLRMVVDSIA